jgi:hypothetical protein
MLVRPFKIMPEGSTPSIQVRRSDHSSVVVCPTRFRRKCPGDAGACDALIAEFVDHAAEAFAEHAGRPILCH